jgi:hypothetical protein
MTDRARDGEGLWLEAAARLQADLDDDVRSQARELFVAEASRTRLQDLGGSVRVTLRSGTVVAGSLMARFGPDATMAVMKADGRILHVVCASVVVMTGAPVGMRDEQESRVLTLAACLRESWAAGDAVRVLLCDGRWVAGTVAFVGADHLELGGDDDHATIPFTALEAWQIAPAG